MPSLCLLPRCATQISSELDGPDGIPTRGLQAYNSVSLKRLWSVEWMVQSAGELPGWAQVSFQF